MPIACSVSAPNFCLLRFGANDTVGIGYNEITKQVFFTKNGEFKGLAGSIKNSDVLQYFLTVGIRGKGTTVRIKCVAFLFPSLPVCTQV